MRRSGKFNAQKTVVDGVTFDSKAEAARYIRLKTLGDEGRLTDLEFQPSFPLMVNGIKCGIYRADFGYREHGAQIYEDVKGMKTPVYKLKAKLVQAIYGVTIRET